MVAGCAACQQLLALAETSSGRGAAQARGLFDRRAGAPRGAGTAFSYDPAAPDGPSRWPGLCSAGSAEQSPVDVAEGVLTSRGAGGGAGGACRAARLDFSAYRGPQRGVTVRNVGFGAEVCFPPGNFLRVVVPPPDGAGSDGNGGGGGGNGGGNGGGSGEGREGEPGGRGRGQQQQDPVVAVRRLELLQYHFHEPGEHAVSGRRGSMEAHLVHRDLGALPSSAPAGARAAAARSGGGGAAPSGLAVVALLLDAAPPSAAARRPGGGQQQREREQEREQEQEQQERESARGREAGGSASAALSVLLDHAPAERGAEREVPYAVDPAWLARGAAALDGGAANFFAYRGSLTTPPCSEGVDWYVLASRAAVVGAEQVAAFRAFERALPGRGVAAGRGNARPLQPLNGRAVRFNCLG